MTGERGEELRGLERRFPGGVPEDRRQQAEYELDVILKMGFPGYFLVTADLVFAGLFGAHLKRTHAVGRS